MSTEIHLRSSEFSFNSTTLFLINIPTEFYDFFLPQPIAITSQNELKSFQE
jgi:hypothetical protein